MKIVKIVYIALMLMVLAGFASKNKATKENYNLPVTTHSKWDKKDVWLTSPNVYGGSIFFPDELVPLAQAVADVLTKPETGGFRVIPVDDVLLLWKKCQKGLLPGTKKVCKAKPPPALLTEHLYAGASIASTTIRCKENKKCELTVVIRRTDLPADTPYRDKELVRFTAALPADENPTQWGSRLRQVGLRQVPQPQNVKRGILAIISAPPGESGSLDRSVIRRTIHSNASSIRAVYVKQLELNPALSGKVEVRFEIVPDGRVTSAETTKSTVGDKEFVKALLKVVKGWRFPRSPGGHIVVVNYPFRFNFQKNSFAFDVNSILPSGVHRAEIRFLEDPPQLSAISKKFRKAIQSNAEWFGEYIKKYQGKTLQWHKNMAITQDEYELITKSLDQLKFKKVHDTRLSVQATDRGVSVNTGGRWKFFEQLEMVVSNDGETITTTAGKLRNRRAIKASDGQIVTGPWDGMCWTSNTDRDRLSAYTSKGFIDICIGILKNRKQGLLTYEARSKESKNPHHNTDFAIYFNIK